MYFFPFFFFLLFKPASFEAPQQKTQLLSIRLTRYCWYCSRFYYHRLPKIFALFSDTSLYWCEILAGPGVRLNFLRPLLRITSLPRLSACGACFTTALPHWRRGEIPEIEFPWRKPPKSSHWWLLWAAPVPPGWEPARGPSGAGGGSGRERRFRALPLMGGPGRGTGCRLSLSQPQEAGQRRQLEAWLHPRGIAIG